MSEISRSHSLQHLDSLLNVSLEIGSAFFQNRTALSSRVPACVLSALDNNAIDETCVSQFIHVFGRRALRRNPTSTEVTSLLATYRDSAAALTGATLQERLGLVVARLVASPDLNFHFEIEAASPQNTSSRSRVDQFTIASRLSYGLVGTMPDDTLLDAASNNMLTTVDQVRTQARRLIATQRARDHFKDLVRFWLRLDSVAAPSTLASNVFGIPSDAPTRNRVRDEIVDETLAFVDYIVFQKNGAFVDLMTSNASFPYSVDSARILNVPFSTAGANSPTTDGRRGLVTRPSLLLSNLDRERPIHRGVLVRQRLLCDVIPAPPANADQLASDNVQNLNSLLMSIREYSAHTTKNASCAGCHSQINPLGFVLGGYGALGQKILTEDVFDSDQNMTARFTPNTSATDLNVFTPKDSANSDQDLITLVSKSSKAKACVAQMLFQFSRVRDEIPADSCQLNESEALIRSGKPVVEAWLSTVASEDIFWKGK